MGPQITTVNAGQSAELETVMDIFREMFSGHYHRAGDEGRHVYITARVSKYITGRNRFQGSTDQKVGPRGPRDPVRSGSLIELGELSEVIILNPCYSTISI